MMTSPAFDLQIPATEIEISEAIKVSDPDVADTIRRLAFQRDRLVAEIERLNSVAHMALVGQEELQRALSKTQAEFERLQAFRDAVYENIVENAGAQAAFAYIWQDRWNEIKAAEKGHATPIDT